MVLTLDGYGLLSVELFVYDDGVVFSEVLSCPYDTGVTVLVSRDLPESTLHVRVSLGLPIGRIRQYGPTISVVILPRPVSQNVTFDSVQNAIGVGLQIYLFGKPEIGGSRRLGVTLAIAESVVNAIEHTKHAAGQVEVQG